MPSMVAENNKLLERLCGYPCKQFQKGVSARSSSMRINLEHPQKFKFGFIHHHHHHHYNHHHHPHRNHCHHHHHQPHSVYPASSGGGVNMLKQMERLQVLLAEYHHDVYGNC